MKEQRIMERTRTRFQIWTIRKGEEEKKVNLILVFVLLGCLLFSL